MKKLLFITYNKNKKIEKLTKKMMKSGHHHVSGKMHKLFLPMLVKNIEKYSIEITDEDPDILIPVYSEERNFENIIPLIDYYKKQNPNLIVFNQPHIAKIIADKRETNIVFSKNGIKFPKLITSSDGYNLIFVNDITGTKKSVSVINSKKVDKNKHNTEFIDTSVKYNNNKYFTCIRSHVVSTPKKVSVVNRYVRIRPNTETPSVHSGDTLKQNMDDIIYFNQTFLDYYKNQVDKISIDLCKLLGCGFWVVDILVKEDDIYVCEVGMKVTESSYFLYQPISKDVIQSYKNNDNKYLKLWIQKTIDSFLQHL